MLFEVCAGIGVGKTTLVQNTQEMNITQLYEDYANIGFLSLFFIDPALYGLEKNLAFLLHHQELIIKGLSSSEHQICDFSCLYDEAIAESNLDDYDFGLYKRIANRFYGKISSQRTIIFLSCDITTQIERIHRRGRDFEKNISKEYLEDINNKIDRKIYEFQSQGGKIIEVDSRDLNSNNLILKYLSDFSSYDSK